MRARTPLLVAAAFLTAAALAGCTTTPIVTPSSTATPTVEPTIDPGTEVLPTAAPELRPDGTAEQNKLYWDAAIASYSAQHGLGGSLLLIDHLTAWGFSTSAMEITWDATAIGLGVDSIEVSVRFGDKCLLADVRHDRYATTILPVLGTGKCLVGETHQIG